jgi:hypothetical protein
MAHQWLDADVDALRRLAWMVDTVYRGEGTAALAGEARQLEDRFGLSPVSRRRLQWSIEPTEVVRLPERRSDQERRRRLMAVDPR